MLTGSPRRVRALLATAILPLALAGEAEAATLVTSFRLESDDTASARIVELAGRADAGPTRRLAVWLRAGTGPRVSVAHDIAVASDGTWRLSLPSGAADVALEGLTVQRWLVCAYDASDVHADPADPATLDCGPYAGGGADPRYDVDLDTLILETTDGGRTRRVEAYALARDLRIAEVFVVDGSHLDASGDDGAWTWHDFESSPPGRTVDGYRASGNCPPPADAEGEWCDSAPRIPAEPTGGGELAHVHAGVLVAAPGHALIALVSEAREPALPAMAFDADFGATIRVEPTGVACSSDPAGGAGAAAAVALTRGASLLAVLQPATRRRPRPVSGREGSRPSSRSSARTRVRPPQPHAPDRGPPAERSRLRAAVPRSRSASRPPRLAALRPGV
ncbi:MAG: hypothetical protein IPK07_07575 [Deltaproteobacteria bacterium]|nr:hypothetical protein [Deltaproteobacteria bacterium]